MDVATKRKLSPLPRCKRYVQWPRKVECIATTFNAFVVQLQTSAIDLLNMTRQTSHWEQCCWSGGAVEEVCPDHRCKYQAGECVFTFEGYPVRQGVTEMAWIRVFLRVWPTQGSIYVVHAVEISYRNAQIL